MPPPDEPTQHLPAPDNSGDGWVLGGRYRVTGRIGSGGMADVFRAHDELLARDVAVKVFRSAAATADTAAGIERQRAELHALARLNHPNLITLYDGSITGVDGERAYLVMELVEGPNLGDRIDRGPLPTEAETRMIGAQVAEALAYVHDQGMVHRDIKPANILLGAGAGTEQVRARLSDFGIVRLLGADRLTQADSTLGTASYLAPEQARGSGVGPAADVYALGLTLIEALTGVRSFDGPTPLEAVVARLDHDPEIPQHLPQPWPSLLAAMTARDPAARPSAAQVGAALRGVAGATTQFIPAGAAVTGATTVIPSAAPMPPVRPTYAPPPVVDEPEPRRRNTGLIVGLVLAAVLIALGAAILIATTGGDDNGGTPAPSTSQSTTEKSRSSSTRTTRSTQRQTERNSAPATTDAPTTEQRQSSTQDAPSTPDSPSTPPSTPATSSKASTSSSASSSSSSPAAEAPVAPTSSSPAP